MIDLYDAFASCYEADFGDYSADLPFYLDLARQTGGPLLELMCGTGRVLLPLAKAGYRVTGVDCSGEALDIARGKLAGTGLERRVTLLEADARDVVLPRRRFAMALIAFNSFAHLETVADQLSVLATVKQALKPTGALLIDLLHFNPILRAGEAGQMLPGNEYELQGRLVRKSVSYRSELAIQVNTVTFHYEEHDRHGHVASREVQFRMRWFYRYELEHLLLRAGFLVRGIYGSYHFEPHTSRSHQLIAIASPHSF